MQDAEDAVPLPFDRSRIYGSSPTDAQKAQLVGFKEDVLKYAAGMGEYDASLLRNPGDKLRDITEYVDSEILLHRFMQARKYDQAKAVAMLTNHLHWRFEKRRPFEIKCAEMEYQAVTGKAQVSPHGKDSYGRPIIILDDSKENLTIKDAAEKQKQAMRFLAFNLERATRQLTDGVQRYVVFITLEDFSLWSAPNLATTKETIDMVTNQYPERLGHAILFKAPYVFTSFYNAISMFLDAETASKIVFISGDTSVGTQNDTKLTEILGNNWRAVCGQEDPPYEENGSRGYRHADAWKKAKEEESIFATMLQGMNISESGDKDKNQSSA